MSAIPEETDTRQAKEDAEHLKYLAVGFFVVSGLSILALVLLGAHYLLFSSLLADPQFAKGSNAVPEVFRKIMNLGYLVTGSVILILGILNLVAGLFLRQRRHRLVILVIGSCNLFHVPFGAMLCLGTFLVLQRSSVKDLFDRSPPTA